MNLEFNVEMQLADFKGEELIDSSVWISKSHHPLDMGSVVNKANKVICCVRNPFDTIVSFMQFLPTLQQGGVINEKFSDFPEVWDKFLREVTDIIADYHANMTDELAKEIPCYFLRYEDLRSKPQETLEALYCFILDVPSVEGLNIQRRIKQVVDLGHSASVTYK